MHARAQELPDGVLSTVDCLFLGSSVFKCCVKARDDDERRFPVLRWSFDVSFYRFILLMV